MHYLGAKWYSYLIPIYIGWPISNYRVKKTTNYGKMKTTDCEDSFSSEFWHLTMSTPS